MIYVVEELAHFALDKLRKGKPTSENVAAKSDQDKPSDQHQHGDHVHEEIPTDLFANLDKGTFQVNTLLWRKNQQMKNHEKFVKIQRF